MGEPSPKRLRFFDELNDDESLQPSQDSEQIDDEILSNAAESCVSTEATFSAEAEIEDEADFEYIESPEPVSDQAEFEYIESPEPVSDHEGEDISVEGESQDESQDESLELQWWAAGPAGEGNFLLLLGEELVHELGHYGLSSVDPLPFGWVVDEDTMLDFAISNHFRD